MRTILRLGTSDDENDRVPASERTAAVAERTFAALTGQPAVTISKRMWPTASFPGLLKRWLDETEPDVVLLWVAAYWVTYRSVPLKLQRRLGTAGGRLAGAGQAAADVRWLSESRPFHFGRRWLLRTVGGEANFTVDEVADVVEQCARTVLAKEGTVLVVRGPQNALSADTSPKAIARAERTRVALHRRVRAICERLHVEYIGQDEPYETAADRGLFLGDLVHGTAAMHRQRGEEEGKALAAAWLRER